MKSSNKNVQCQKSMMCFKMKKLFRFENSDACLKKKGKITQKQTEKNSIRQEKDFDSEQS